MAILIYTGMRLLLLVAVIGLFHALGMRGILLLVAGFAVSAVLSYFILSAPRDAMAQKVSGYFGRLNKRIDTATKSEDLEPRAAHNATEGDDIEPAAADATTTEGGPSPTSVTLPTQPDRDDRS